MIQPSSLHKETLTQKSQIEKDFHVVKLVRILLPFYFSLLTSHVRLPFQLIHCSVSK